MASQSEIGTPSHTMENEFQFPAFAPVNPVDNNKGGATTMEDSIPTPTFTPLNKVDKGKGKATTTYDTDGTTTDGKKKRVRTAPQLPAIKWTPEHDKWLLLCIIKVNPTRGGKGEISRKDWVIIAQEMGFDGYAGPIQQHFNKELKPCEWRVVEGIEFCRKPYSGPCSCGATMDEDQSIKEEDAADDEGGAEGTAAAENAKDGEGDVEGENGEETTRGEGRKRKAAAQSITDFD